MLFNRTEIDVMDDLYCYENEYQLVINEMDDDDKNMYMENNDYWDTSLNEWFMKQLSHKIFKIDINKDKILYIFYRGNDDIDCDIEELINKIFNNYDVKNKSDFEETIVQIQDEFNTQGLTDEEKELLKILKVYDDLYDLVEEYHTEEDLEEYISYYENLEYKFKDWFFNRDAHCYEYNYLYLYIDSEKMFIPKENLKIRKQIRDLFEKYDIYNTDTIETLKKQNNIGDDE